MKTEFRFLSEGETLVGNLFLPCEQSKPASVVVAVGPLTSVKEQAAGTYAQGMAERGYAALAFDHRYFGESGGRPRQFENPVANIEDIKNGRRCPTGGRPAGQSAGVRSRRLLWRRADGAFGC
jgi:fermentation-respiration switch protein FrsA (DUF1100 family)